VEQTEAMFLIHLDGELTISIAPELKQIILRGLASAQTLSFDLQDVSEVDITALQLLWAARREARALGLQTAISRQVTDCVLSAGVDAGFETFPMSSK